MSGVVLQSYQRIQHNFINNTTATNCVVGILGGSTSLLRIYELGVLPIHFLHSLLIISSLVTFLFRHRLSYKVKVYSCISFYALIGLGGFWQFGLISAGYLAFSIVIFLVAVVAGKRASVYALILTTLIMCFFGGLWHYGILSSNIDYSSYLTATNTWVMFTIVFFTFAQLLSNVMGTTMEELRERLAITYQQKREIEHLANHDQLTGLPSLRLADDRLDMAIALANRNQSRSALVYLDLDGFKSINDGFGHAAGDAILQQIALRFNQAIRATDTCCRIGGDEFLIIVPDIAGQTELQPLCERIIKALKTPFQFEQKPLTVGVSIGVAIYPDNASDAKALRQSADEAMLLVKRSGKNNYQFSCAQPKAV